MIAPDFPNDIAYLWEWFIELNTTRANVGFGAMPISYTEIYSWSALHLINLHPWEVKAIKKLDAVFMKKRSEKSA